MPRHILHLIDTSTLSGSGKTILNSCKFTDRARYIKSVAVFRGKKENTFLSCLKDSGVQAFEIRESLEKFPKTFSYLSQVLELKTIIKKNGSSWIRVGRF